MMAGRERKKNEGSVTTESDRRLSLGRLHE